MKKTIITKIIYQLIIGAALAIVYMQIRPHEAYTLSWPFAFLGSWFLLVGWFNYLKYDKLSIFELHEEHKKDQERRQLRTKSKMKTMIDYVNTAIQPDTTYTDKEKSIIKMVSNFITSAVFFILACIF